MAKIHLEKSEFIATLRAFLTQNADEKYANFVKKCAGFGNLEPKGVKIPLLRSFAKKFSSLQIIESLNNLEKTKNKSFCEEQFESAEEPLFLSILIGKVLDNFAKNRSFYSFNDESAKCDLIAAQELILRFVPIIDNWLVCDIFCANLRKFYKINEFREQNFSFFASFANIDSIESSCENNEFIVRFGLVSLLYFIDPPFLARTLKIVQSCATNSAPHYVKMACAWAVCECFVENQKAVYEILKTKKLDKFVQNKAISKCADSYRIGGADKQKLKELRIK